MNIIDLIIILFLLIQFFISGSIFHFLFIKKFEEKNITLIPKLLVFGIFTNISFLQIWHLFLPVNIYCALFLHLTQIYFILRKNSFTKYFKIIKLVPFHLGIIFFIFISWISILTNAELGPSDSGLYHLPIINWNNTYRIVKGLANLSIDYGINSNLFLLISLVKNYPYYNNFLWTFNAVFLSIGFFSFFCIPLQYIIEKKDCYKEIIFRLLFNIPLVHYCFYFFPGTSTDLPVFIISCLISIEFIFLLSADKSHNDIIPILIFMGITIKLSFLFYGFGIFCIYLFVIQRKNTSSLKHLFTKPFYIFLLTSLIWLSRGVFLSGYPLLPITSISFPVSWKINKAEANNMNNAIVNYGLETQQNVSLIKKINLKKDILITQLTIQHRRIEILYPLIFGFFGLIYGFIYRKEKHLIILFPILIQMLIWVYIPKNRYSSFACWWFCSHYLSLFLESYVYRNIVKYFPIFIIFLSISFHKVDSLGQKKIFFPKFVTKKIPNTDLKSFKTNSNFEIFTLPPGEDQCWDAELLCTPYPNKNLTPYNEFDLEKGFYLQKNQ